MAPSNREERIVPLEQLGQTLRELRLATEEALERMQRSLSRHGQLTALAVYCADDGALEIVDGFKRLLAAQKLGWAELRVRAVASSMMQAKLALTVLNESHNLTDLEEAWLVRSLYRHDKLSQPQIAQLLGRHKSWVCRRLLMVETLDETVQADMRLGLLGPTLARSLTRLPRGNQRLAAKVVIRKGLTSRQTEKLVNDVLGVEEGRRDKWLQEVLANGGKSDAMTGIASLASGRQKNSRTALEWIVADVATMTRLCGRLQARLLEQGILALDDPGARLVIEALLGLKPLLAALDSQIEQVHQTGKGAIDVKLEHSRRTRTPNRNAIPPGAFSTGDSARTEHQP